jgi:hypothetical protein
MPSAPGGAQFLVRLDRRHPVNVRKPRVLIERRIDA